MVETPTQQLYFSVTVSMKLYELVKSGVYGKDQYDALQDLHHPKDLDTFGIARGARESPLTSLDLVFLDRSEIKLLESQRLRRTVKQFVVVCDNQHPPQRANWHPYGKMGVVGLVTYTNPPEGFMDIRQALYELLIKKARFAAPAGIEDTIMQPVGP